ncbi:Cthe_2314 family HEPN domain-containing protein [Tenacibaculum halocynthiae]|uniref:Cthe_2314 family HEPN domain-containing protein n=1 Tax=Tenacibaculum halocynthiae TaxID=1254437 RepID=UPI003D661D32
MRAIDRFNKLDFFRTTLPIMQNYISHQEFDRIITKQTAFEEYNISILLSASNITECLDQINHSIDMLSGYRNKKQSTMNRHDYIVFILENFYLRVTSTFDRMLRLTNIIFEIGLPEKECKVSTIVKNKKIKSTPLAIALKNLNSYVDKFRYSRNKIAHSETYSESRLRDIQGFYIALDDGKNKDIEKYKNFYRTITNEYVAEKKSELRQISNEIEILLERCFEELGPYVIAIGKNYNNN